jgi:protoporphyrinogen oxidase
MQGESVGLSAIELSGESVTGKTWGADAVRITLDVTEALTLLPDVEESRNGDEILFTGD